MRTKIVEQEIDNFAHNVKFLREKHNISKTKMAQMLGVSFKSLNKIENGQIPKRLSVGIVFRIEQYFGVKCHLLFKEQF